MINFKSNIVSNITALTRKGLTGRFLTFGTVDDLTMPYDASGVKHRVIHSSTKPDVSPTGRLTTADTTDYVGNRVYLNGKLDKVLTPYGYLQGGKFHTWLHDYQGNIVAVVVGDSVAQRNCYYPYGLPHATSSLLTNVTFTTPNTHKYSGKEFDTFGGTDLYDFHARYHAPSTGRFMTVDPMAEKYPGISTYMYCAGNPILFVDPSGMKIDAASKGDWDNLKGEIKDKIESLTSETMNMLSQGNNNFGEFPTMIQSLNNTLKNMTDIENSSQSYALNKVGVTENGYLSHDETTDLITINYHSTSNFIHEITHVTQFEHGGIGFINNHTILQDVYDEVEAYQSQYSFDPNSVKEINGIFKLNDYESISPAWVEGLMNSSNELIYSIGGSNSLGKYSIGIFSTIKDVRKAYPHLKKTFKKMKIPRNDQNVQIRYLPGLYYKKNL